MRRMPLIVPLVILLSALQAGLADDRNAPSSTGIYDPDPNHLWNRLFFVFYHQKYANVADEPIGTKSGRNWIEEPHWVGPDVLDPPLGYHPRFLLEDEPFEKCNAVLDEFLNRNGAGLIHDPLKRALLQRDLWAVFDVLAEAGQISSFDTLAFLYFPGASIPASQKRHRTILEQKLARVIRSLALSHEEIESLPDTYNAAIQSDAFTDVLATNRYNFLPRDLFAAGSGWHEIVPRAFKPLEPPILQHTMTAGGRSVFRAFVKEPGNFTLKPSKTSDHLPWGTQLLLLRKRHAGCLYEMTAEVS